MLTQVINSEASQRLAKAKCLRCQHGTMVKDTNGDVECYACGYEMVTETPLMTNPSTWAKKQHIDQSFATDAVLWDGVIEEVGVSE